MSELIKKVIDESEATYKFLTEDCNYKDVTVIGDRWCYETYEAASQALADWDCAAGTEPDGWHRHPDSGRRRDKSGKEWVCP